MKHILFIMVLSALVISCSKDKEKKAASNTELLTASPWFNTRNTEEVGGVITEAPFNSFNLCYRDNPYVFTVDGKLETNQGVMRCSGELNFTHQYQWQFKDNETTLALKFNSWADYQIVKLTKDSLVVKMGDAARVNTTYYSHQ
jgi:hypothetical protein